MIGRAAQGRPWIFREIGHFLATGGTWPRPGGRGAPPAAGDHLHDHYSLYGELTGVRSARKHIAWYLRACRAAKPSGAINTIDRQRPAQWQAVADFLDALGRRWTACPPLLPRGCDTEEQEGLPAA